MIDLVSLIDKTVELTPKDLMIGDWVCAGNTIDQITEIAYDEKLQPYVSIAASATFFKVHFKYGIHPMTLTKEVLEDNDFTTKEKGNHFIEDSHHQLELSVKEDGQGKTRIFWTNCLGEGLIFEFKYVHQLQHTLNLLNIDKRILI